VSADLYIIGIDPGPATGIAVAFWDDESWLSPGAYQCDASSAPALLDWLAARKRPMMLVRAAIEEFRPGTGAGARGPHASVTRSKVDELSDVLENRNIRVRCRAATMVKPWATDERLKRAGLMEICRGQGHAADAMRHLLFCAVHDCGVPDPLIRRRLMT
jgi:hypothetical protein